MNDAFEDQLLAACRMIRDKSRRDYLLAFALDEVARQGPVQPLLRIVPRALFPVAGGRSKGNAN